MRISHALELPEEYQYADSVGKEVSEDGRSVSEKEYWENYYNHPDFDYEWKNGYLEEKPMTDVKGSLVYQWFSDILRCYFAAHPIGMIINLEIGFRLALPGDISIRKPDMAVVLNDNPVRLHLSDCNYSGIFDLCIESLSYFSLREIKRDTIDKKKEYQGIGVREYYILDARKIETAFYRLNRKEKYQKITPDRGVIRSEVLPGFRFRVNDLYEQPSLEEMTEDAVYQEYVLPFYRQMRQEAEMERQKAEMERQRAELEWQRAESERQKAELERQRAQKSEQKAESLARKLRELGVEVIGCDYDKQI
jgi:hypothetical protein